MDIRYANELFRLIFNQFDREPNAFVRLFDDSDNFMAYDYLVCEQSEFLDVSASFSKIFGYPTNTILGGNDFFQKTIHKKNKDLYLGFFNILPKKGEPKNKYQGAWQMKEMNCLVKHKDNFWKTITIYSFTYFIEIRGWHKVGVMVDEQKDIPCFELGKRNELLISGNDGKVKITEREREVLTLLSSGMIAKEVAEKLCISTSTVITHRKNLISKLGVRNTAELICKANNILQV